MSNDEASPGVQSKGGLTRHRLALAIVFLVALVIVAAVAPIALTALAPVLVAGSYFIRSVLSDAGDNPAPGRDEASG